LIISTGPASSDQVVSLNFNDVERFKITKSDIFITGAGRGVMTRISDYITTSPTHHFRDGTLPSGFSWLTFGGNGGTPPYVTANSYGDYLSVAGDAGTSYALCKRGPTTPSGCQGKYVYARGFVGVNVTFGVIVWYLISGTWRYSFIEVYYDSTNWNTTLYIRNNLSGTDTATTKYNFGPPDKAYVLRVYHYTDNQVYVYVYDETADRTAMATNGNASAITDSYWGLRFYGSGKRAYVDWIHTNV
jgi:hypothetical protein